MTRLPVCCVLGLLLAMTSPGLTAPTTMSSLDGVLSEIPGPVGFLSNMNMDAAQFVAKVAELNSQGRLGQYVGKIEMFLGLPRGQGSELERVNAIVDAVVPQPEQAALLKAEVTSVLNDGVPGMSAATSGGPLSILTLPFPGNPGFSTGPPFRPSPWVTPQIVGFPLGGTSGTGLTGSGFPGSGFPQSGFPGSGFPESGFPGTGFPGTGFPGSSLSGSGFPGSGLGTNVGPSPGQNGNGAGDFPWLFSSEWQPGAGLQWLFEKLLGGGTNQNGLGGQNAGGWGQGPQAGQGSQGGEGPWLMRVLGDVIGLLFGDGSSSGGGQGGLGVPISGMRRRGGVRVV